MPAYIGDTAIDAAYVGDTAASAIYLGDTQVWSAVVPSNISFVATNWQASTQVVTPVHAVGDFMVVFSSRVSSAFATVPAGWTTVYTSSGVSPTMKVATKVATATNDNTAFGFTNADSMLIGIWRGVSGIGGISDQLISSSTTKTYPAITMTETDGSSWAVRAARATHTATPTVPAGYTQRLDGSGANAPYMCDSNGGVTSAGSINQTMNGSAASRCVTLELLST